MTLKAWIWTFCTVTVLGWSVFFFVDFYYYANVMELGVFISILAVQFCMGVVSVIRKKKAFIYAGFLMMFFAVIYFFVTLPDCTYKEAQQSVIDDYQTDEVKLLSLGHKTVPSDHSSWFLPNKMYYVAVADEDDDGQTDYYAVDTIQGRAVKLEGPYW